MFKGLPPKVLAHKSAIILNSFVTKNRIITKQLNVFDRTCPHKFYLIGEEGVSYETIECQLHGFEYDRYGKGINNKCKLKHVDCSIGHSGLIYEGMFREPNHWSFNKIEDEKWRLHDTMIDHSTGSWLWNMDMDIDVCHIRKNGIHPELSAMYIKEDLELVSGDGWVLQVHHNGFWMLIFPFTFIEWDKGCLMIKTMIPDNMNSEWGFSWYAQFYYSDETTTETKANFFNTLMCACYEDIGAIEKVKEPFRLVLSNDPFEQQNVLFGKWVNENRIGFDWTIDPR